MPKDCNTYGFSGGFAAILAGISWFLVQDRSCKINFAQMLSDKFNTDHLQLLHYIAIIVGLVLLVLSFVDFAGVLAEISLVFLVATLAIFASGVMMLYATYVAFHTSCKSAFGGIDTASILGSRNVFEARDEIGITIMMLDLICGLLLISAAISFSRAQR